MKSRERQRIGRGRRRCDPTRESATLRRCATRWAQEQRISLRSSPTCGLALSDLQAPQRLDDPAQARFRLFDSIAAVLRHASRRRPLVLILDDLHWADTSSLRLLTFLVTELRDSRTLIIGAYRDSELSRGHLLSDTLGELAREPQFQRLWLRGLRREDASHFMARAIGAAPAPELLDAVHRQTEGNPLFLKEVVRLLAQDMPLAPTSSSSGVSIPIPASVREVIGRRLNRLSLDCNRMLMIAAVIGRTFGLDEIALLLDDVSEEKLVDLVDEAVAAHIIESSPQSHSAYLFSHALIRETLCDDLTPARRALLHRRIGEVIEALHHANPEPHLSALAHHFGEAARHGGASKAMVYAQRAGDRNMALLAYEASIDDYRRALHYLEQTPPVDETQRRKLLLALSQAHARAGEYAQAVELFQRVAALARQADASDDLAEAALGLERVTWWAHLEPLAAVSALRDALAALDAEDSVLYARILGALSRVLPHVGDVNRAATYARQAVEMARRLDDPGVLAFNLISLVHVLWEPLRAEERLAYATDMRRCAQRAGDKEIETTSHFLRAFSLLELGHIQAVDADIKAHNRLTAELRQPSYQLVTTGLRAMRAHLGGAF